MLLLGLCAEMDEDETFAAQVRAGRALLNWSQHELADKARISRGALARIESGSRDARVSTVRAVKGILEANGVVFLAADANGFGVRLRKPYGE